MRRTPAPWLGLGLANLSPNPSPSPNLVQASHTCAAASLGRPAPLFGLLLDLAQAAHCLEVGRANPNPNPNLNPNLNPTT